MSTKSSILVTGCAGFIGSNFVKQFKKQFPKTTIVGIDDFSTSKRDELDSGITFYEGSILDTALLEKIFKKHKPTYVFNFAALPRVSFSIQFPIESAEANVLGAINLLEQSARHGVKRFIQSSSSSIYGDAKPLPVKEKVNPAKPKSPYAAQKYAVEEFCRIYSELYDMDTVCLRYFTVYGPGQYGDSPYITVISAWLESHFFPKNKDGFIEGNGSQSRDFCYVDNVVQANIKAMQCKKRLGGMHINIAHNDAKTLKQVRKAIENILGEKLALETRKPRAGDVKHTLADISTAKRLLGYKPTISFEEGLERTIEWFKSRKS